MRVRLLTFPVLGIAVAAAVIASPALPAGAASSDNSINTQFPPAFITGTGNGAAPHVKVFATPDHELSGFYDHDPAQTTGARVASGDTTGDLQPEIITGTGPGVASKVTVRKLDGTVLGSFSPYGNFAGGVNVAAGDVDGDTKAEIITGADAGGGPNVIVWDFENGVATKKFDFFPYDSNFHGGVYVAVAQLVGSTKDDIVTSPGAGGGPHVRVFDVGSGAPVEAASFFAYAPSMTAGVRISAGELNGAPAIVTGAGPGGGPHVRWFTSKGVLKGEFFAYPTNFLGGVNVSIVSAQGGDLGYVLTAPASQGGPHVRGFRPTGDQLNINFFAYNAAMNNGVSIAAIPQLGAINNTNQSGGS